MKQKKPLSHQSNLRIFAANGCTDPLKESLSEGDSFGISEGDNITKRISITCLHSKDLDETTLTWINELTEKNMKDHYEKSANGWNPKQKEKELRHETARFLVCHVDSDKEMIAFVHFRFELDDEAKHPAVYCYEIQVEKEWQSKGIGRHLMKVLQEIGFRFKMFKVMLTCFKHNQTTLSFYEKLGYTPDIRSPSRCGDMTADYEILSKRIRESK